MTAVCLANFCDRMLLGSWWSDVTFGLEMFPTAWWFNLKEGLLLGSGWAILGLVTVWVVWGRERWFVRAAGAIGLLWMLLPLNVPDAAWLHCLQVAFVGLSVLAARGVSIWLRRRKPKQVAPGEPHDRPDFQFSMVDLLYLNFACATVVTGLILLMSQPMTSSWESRLTFSGHGAAVILSTMWLVFGKRVWPVRAILFFGSALATVERCFVTVLFYGDLHDFYWTGFPLLVPLVNLCGALLLWLGIVAGRVWYAREPSGAGSSPVRDGVERRRRVFAAVGMLLLAAPSLVLYVNLLWPLPPKETTEEGENHWDELVARCAGFERVTPLDADVDPPAAFVTSYQTHQVDVAEIQRLLRLPIRRRVEYDMAFDLRSNYIQHIRGGARALGASGNGQIVLGQWDEAAQTFGDIVRLGEASAHGGLLIDHMIDMAIEGMGQTWIIRFSDKFSSAQCRGLIATLAAVEVEHESPEVVNYRDRVWEMYASIPGSRVQDIIEYPWNRDLSTRPTKYLFAFQRRDAQLRLVMCHLAMRAFTLDHGRTPASLAELVPEYLPAVPIDPYDGRPLRFRVGENGKLLVYSVGPDGVDEGGRIVRLPELNQAGDASLESFFSDLFPAAATPDGPAGNAAPLSESEPPPE